MDIQLKKKSIEQELKQTIDMIGQLVVKRDNLVGQYQLISEMEKESVKAPTPPQGSLEVVDNRK